MFSNELQQLIEASLVDGVLTDQERAVIRKRALLDGVDPDEVDVLLDAELQRIRQKQEEAVAKVKKCPNCGEIIPSLSAVCPSCGHIVNKDGKENRDLMELIDDLGSILGSLRNGKTYIASYEEKAITRGLLMYEKNPQIKNLIEEIELLRKENKKRSKRKRLISTGTFWGSALIFVYLIYSCNANEWHAGDGHDGLMWLAFLAFIVMVVTALYKLYKLLISTD